MNSIYYNKYLKYKSKYLELKNIKYNQIGGELPIITKPENINLFTDSEMEIYMNPIHGLVLYYSGSIPNIYWLNINKFIDQQVIPNFNTDLKKKGELITKVCKKISGSIQPTNDLKRLKPIDYGRFIAIKYIKR